MIKIGKALIIQVGNAKLLGVKIEENQDCNKQIQSSGGGVSPLKQRHLNKENDKPHNEQLKKVAKC